MTPYDDIISLPHPTSRRHPRMSQADRAAQFGAFAALRGFDEEIDRTRLERLDFYEPQSGEFDGNC